MHSLNSHKNETWHLINMSLVSDCMTSCDSPAGHLLLFSYYDIYLLIVFKLWNSYTWLAPTDSQIQSNYHRQCVPKWHMSLHHRFPKTCGRQDTVQRKRPLIGGNPLIGMSLEDKQFNTRLLYTDQTVCDIYIYIFLTKAHWGHSKNNQEISR